MINVVYEGLMLLKEDDNIIGSYKTNDYRNKFISAKSQEERIEITNLFIYELCKDNSASQSYLNIKKLNLFDVISIELSDRGFEIETNPFLTFLLKYFKDGTKGMTKAKYILLHDLHADGIIEGKWLKDSTSIVYCDHLWYKQNDEIIYYINTYRWCILNSNKLIAKDQYKEETKNAIKNNPEMFSKALVYSNGKIDFIENTSLVEEVQAGDNKSELRSIQDIKDILNKILIKEDKEESKPIEDDNEDSYDMSWDSMLQDNKYQSINKVIKALDINKDNIKEVIEYLRGSIKDAN